MSVWQRVRSFAPACPPHGLGFYAAIDLTRLLQSERPVAGALQTWRSRSILRPAVAKAELKLRASLFVRLLQHIVALSQVPFFKTAKPFPLDGLNSHSDASISIKDIRVPLLEVC